MSIRSLSIDSVSWTTSLSLSWRKMSFKKIFGRSTFSLFFSDKLFWNLDNLVSLGDEIVQLLHLQPAHVQLLLHREFYFHFSPQKVKVEEFQFSHLHVGYFLLRRQILRGKRVILPFLRGWSCVSQGANQLSTPGKSFTAFIIFATIDASTTNLCTELHFCTQPNVCTQEHYFCT